MPSPYHNLLLDIDGEPYEVVYSIVPPEPDVGINGGVCVEGIINSYTGARESTDGYLADKAAEFISDDINDPGL